MTLVRSINSFSSPCFDTPNEVHLIYFVCFLQALLKEEMKSLRAAVGKSEVKAAAAVKDVREEVLKQMDEIHLRKRKEKDEKLAKEHPDFQATRKMRGN